MHDDPQVVDAIERAITEAMDVLPVQWVLVVADADGNTHSIASTYLPLWQRRGLLNWEAEGIAPQPTWDINPDD